MKNNKTKLEVLLEEKADLEGKISALPVGYISEKSINGGNYYYLQHRVGKRVISDYILPQRLGHITRQIKMRKFYEKQLKAVKQELASQLSPC